MTTVVDQRPGPEAGPGRRSARTSLTFLLVGLVAVELAVRVIASDLPPPARWLGPEMGLKEQQMSALQSDGGASVVFVGSSTVDVSVDPSRLEVPDGFRPPYNAATGAGSLEIISTWTRRVVVPRLRPDAVVVGLVSRELNGNDPAQAELTRDFFDAPAVRDLLDNQSVLQELEWAAESWSDVVLYRRTLRQPKVVFDSLRGEPIRRGTFGEIIADDGRYEGFDDTRYLFTPQIERFFRNTALREYEVSPTKVAELRNLLAELTSSGVKVLVVSMPTGADYIDLHPDGADDQARFVAAVQAEADRVGARFVDVGIYPDGELADPGHLNAEGSARFTAWIQGEVDRLLR